MELEGLVFEIVEDWQLGAEVDWSLFLAEFTRLGSVNDFGSLLLDFWFDIKIDSWSLGKRILVVLIEVVFEIVDMILLAVWTTEDWLEPSDLLVIFHVEMEEGTFLGFALQAQIVGIVRVAVKVDMLDSKGTRLLDLLICPFDIGRMVGMLTFGFFLHSLVGVGPREHGAFSGSGLGQTKSVAFSFVHSSFHDADVVQGILVFETTFALLVWSKEVRLVVLRLDSEQSLRIGSIIVLSILSVGRFWVEALVGQGLLFLVWGR